jgi:hypothetical protein
MPPANLQPGAAGANSPHLTENPALPFSPGLLNLQHDENPVSFYGTTSHFTRAT